MAEINALPTTDANNLELSQNSKKQVTGPKTKKKHVKPSFLSKSTNSDVKQTVKRPTVITRHLTYANERKHNEATKILIFADEVEKTQKTKTKSKKRKLEQEIKKIQESSMPIPEKSIAELAELENENAPPNPLGDECEDDDINWVPQPKGTSRLIANLERFYSKGYVEGYDADDDWIDDGGEITDFAINQEESSKTQTEFQSEKFYIHQGAIKLIQVEESKIKKSGKPPHKKRKLAHTAPVAT